MESIKAIIEFFLVNKEAIFSAILALITVAEVIVRFTPTKEDDGAVERVGKMIRKLMDILKVPNIKK